MFCALVLAGERPGGNVLSRQLKLSSSVLVDVAGQTALYRVIDALKAAKRVKHGVLCGPSTEVFQLNNAIEEILSSSGYQWLSPESGLSASAIKGLKKLRQYPVLVTTGDHALLTSELIDEFCGKCEAVASDFVVGFVPHSLVKSAFPKSKRTVQKYADQPCCGTNLFSVMTPAGLRALEFWQSIEVQRKRPWKMAQKLGAGLLLRYLFGLLTLDEAFLKLSDRCGCKVSYVFMNDPSLAVDVDSLADRDLAEAILRSRRD